MDKENNIDLLIQSYNNDKEMLETFKKFLCIKYNEKDLKEAWLKFKEEYYDLLSDV